MISRIVEYNYQVSRNRFQIGHISLLSLPTDIDSFDCIEKYRDQISEIQQSAIKIQIKIIQESAIRLAFYDLSIYIVVSGQ